MTVELTQQLLGIAFVDAREYHGCAFGFVTHGLDPRVSLGLPLDAQLEVRAVSLRSDLPLRRCFAMTRSPKGEEEAYPRRRKRAM
jgi:hypothetical protein